MENIKQFTLIKGKFNIEDGRSIVLNFFNTKINFHNLELLTASESGQGDKQAIEQKISDLNKTRQEVIELLAGPDPGDEILEIQGHISIRKTKL
ncbi:hypothetical protein [Mucilaginibacter flavidus]|uniref:hypothetical protein n=1 Tax=Mucilaginibacter flavidus TaxID=2949309 RepID=UPI00209388C9|nr:hypothetical protein [Mucilaginibacter flavidus]MCO5947996.1 hypothetical protein [Mucilaginibacter flavidus]